LELVLLVEVPTWSEVRPPECAFETTET